MKQNSASRIELLKHIDILCFVFRKSAGGRGIRKMLQTNATAQCCRKFSFVHIMCSDFLKNNYCVIELVLKMRTNIQKPVLATKSHFIHNGHFCRLQKIIFHFLDACKNTVASFRNDGGNNQWYLFRFYRSYSKKVTHCGG